MSIRDKGIAVVGSTTIDKIVSHLPSVTKIGGVTAYAGITYSRHGIGTQVVSNIAPTDRQIVRRLQKENITVLNGPTNRTTRFINDIRQDYRKQTLYHRARSIQASQLSAVITRVGGLHLGPLHPDDIAPEALAALHNTGLKVFLDIQGYTRKVANRCVSAAVSRHLSSALKTAHVIKANGAELRLIVEHYQKNLLKIMKSFEIDESVITLGHDGGWVATLQGDKFKYNADRIETVTDSTGAGDVFFAAYLVSRFAHLQDIPAACRHGARTAARQVAGGYITIDRLAIP